MSKVKSTFCCQNCGAQHSKWLGQCSACKEWNTIVEEIIKKENIPILGLTKDQLSSKIQLIGDVDFNNDPRLNIVDEEFNRVLGGGIVPGSLILIGGEPGIGKSTLLLQISLMINHKVLYVSGEETDKTTPAPFKITGLVEEDNIAAASKIALSPPLGRSNSTIAGRSISITCVHISRGIFIWAGAEARFAFIITLLRTSTIRVGSRTSS